MPFGAPIPAAYRAGAPLAELVTDETANGHPCPVCEKRPIDKGCKGMCYACERRVRASGDEYGLGVPESRRRLINAALDLADADSEVDSDYARLLKALFRAHQMLAQAEGIATEHARKAHAGRAAREAAGGSK